MGRVLLLQVQLVGLVNLDDLLAARLHAVVVDVCAFLVLALGLVITALVGLALQLVVLPLSHFDFIDPSSNLLPLFGIELRKVDVWMHPCALKT